MPKLGMEALRRRELIEAAIAAIGECGSLDVTMSQIAGRAGVSPALAHHYFGAKEELLQATMRHILAELGTDAAKALAAAEPALMKAAQRNIIHKNNASRKVSRLTHQIAKLAK